MRRLLSLTLALAVITGVFCVPAYAADEGKAVREVVQAFLQDYAEDALLYGNRDLTKNTISDPGTPVTLAGGETFKLSSGAATLSDMQNNVEFIKEKAQYFKDARQLQGITRTALDLTYNFSDVTVSGSTASVEVSELASFYYTGETQQSFAETIYRVDLIKIDGRWLIADVTDSDWFDAEFKKDPVFSAQNEIAKLKAAQNSESGCIVQSLEDGLAPMTSAPYQIPYNAENAVAYAYTYTRQDPSAIWSDYYNQDFYDWHSDGDCMNFASQCMWAGFSGDQTRASIDAHNIPMDTDATNVWYSCSRDKADGYSYSSASWRACSYFRSYMTGTNAASDIGMKAKVVDVASGANFSGVTTTELKGAAAHVEGSSGPLGHAIVITEATGLARSQIYFCAHTTDHKYVKLGDYFPSCTIKAFIPQYFRTSVSPANSLKVAMLRPVALNSTGAVSCSTDATQYKFTISITTPSGTTTSNSVYNATSCSYSYQFTETGLYKVTCYSKTTSSSTAQAVTFYVLSY